MCKSLIAAEVIFQLNFTASKQGDDSKIFRLYSVKMKINSHTIQHFFAITIATLNL